MSYVFQPGQTIFATEFARKTGLDRNVVLSWLYNEENGSAAASRQAQGNHNWLNIGYTDSGQRGTGASFWRNPVTAADASAEWLKGNLDVPGFGRSASSIRAIQGAAGQSPELQIAIIQRSGWASGGEASMRAIYQGLSGHHVGAVNAPGVGGLAHDAAGLPGIKQAVGAVDATVSAGKFLGKLTDPSYILRGLQVVAGGVLVLVGLVLLARQVGLAFGSSDAGQALIAGARRTPGVGTLVEEAGQRRAYSSGERQGRRAAARREGANAGRASVSRRSESETTGRKRSVKFGETSTDYGDVPY